MIEKNINIGNELNFSEVYQSVNYIGSLANVNIHFAQCSLHFDKPQKDKINSSNKHRNNIKPDVTRILF